MKSVIFFNRKKLYLVFPVAYLSMQLKNFELVPVTFSELITRGLKDNEEAYILGIGPTDETEDTELLFFLEKNSTRIKFWLTEHDFNDILRCVKNYEKVMSLYSPGQSCLPELAKLGYTLPQSWQKNSSFIFHNIQESEKNGKQA